MPVRVNLAIAHERVKDDVEKPWIRKTPKGKRTTTTNNITKTPRGSPTQVGVLFFFCILLHQSVSQRFNEKKRYFYMFILL